MKERLKKFLSLIIPLLIGIAIIYYQFSNLTDEEYFNIKKSLLSANYAVVLVSLIIAFFGHFIRAYRWQYALNHIGYKTSFFNRFLTVGISYLVNYTIPRSGEVTRAVLLKKYEKVPFDKGFGTIVAERIVDLCIFFLFVVLAFILEYDTLFSFFAKHLNPKQIALLICILILFSGIGLYLYFKSNIPFIVAIKNKLNGLVEGLTSVIKLKEKKRYIFYSFLIWVAYFCMFYIAILALPETTSITFVTALMGFIFGSLAIGFTNSGLGAYPFAIAQIFLLYKIPLETGIAFGWLVWTSQTIFTIIIGLICYILLPILNKNSN